jgi:hypothetical protein
VLPYGSLFAYLGSLVGRVKGTICYVHITVRAFWKWMGSFIVNTECTFWVLEHEVGSHGLWCFNFPVGAVGDRAGMMFPCVVEGDVIGAGIHRAIKFLFLLPVNVVHTML